MSKPENAAVLPVHDAKTFGRRYASAPGFGEVVWSTFRAHAPQLVAELARAVSANEDAEVFRLSHSLRGNAAMVAAPALEQLAHELEGAAAEPDRPRYAPLLARIETALAQVLAISTPPQPAGPR